VSRRARPAEARVYLEAPLPRHGREFVAAARRSKKLHAAWVSAPSTLASFARFVERAKIPTRRVFLVRLKGTHELAGVVSLGDIVLGFLRGAYVGYYALEPHARKGYMTEGVALALDFAFEKLGLNRVEINVQPRNTRSLRLALSLGFRREGFSPKYVMINGRFRDHVRTAMLAEEWRTRRNSAGTRTGANDRRAGTRKTR
jgi:[ribosomal protein S5]-alanine N-acetyltransferase